MMSPKNEQKIQGMGPALPFILIDECLPVSLKKIITALWPDHPVIHIHDMGWCGRQDPDIARHLRDGNGVLFTQDSDFVNQNNHWRKDLKIVYFYNKPGMKLNGSDFNTCFAAYENSIRRYIAGDHDHPLVVPLLPLEPLPRYHHRLAHRALLFPHTDLPERRPKLTVRLPWWQREFPAA